MTLWIEAIGWLGAALTLSAYSSRTMIPLRSAAVFANLSFISYGALAEVWPTLGLHLALLPLNLWRLREMIALTRRARAARNAPDAFGWIAQVQKARAFPKGTVLFTAGEPADFIYYLETGDVRLGEIDVTLTSGALFGEIAFFSDDRRRTASAVCETDCRIVAIDEARFMAAFHQDPAFGLAIVRLVAQRLIANARGAAPALPAGAVSEDSPGKEPEINALGHPAAPASSAPPER